MAYLTSELPATSLTFARGGSRSADDLELIVKRLESSLRRAEKIPRSVGLLKFGPSVKEEIDFGWQCHCPFWSSDWSLDSATDVAFSLERRWSKQLLGDWLRLLSDAQSLQLGISCIWRNDFGSEHQFGRLTLSRMITDVELQAPSDVPANYGHGVEYEASVLPPDQAEQYLTDAVAGPHVRAAVRGMGLQSFIRESATLTPGFEIDLPEELKAAGAIASNCPVLGRRFPIPISLAREFDEPTVARKSFEVTLQQLIAARGVPSVLIMETFPSQKSIPAYIDWMRGLSPVWTNWSFLGRYKKAFNPFSRPKLPPGETRVYPVLEYHDGKGFGAITALFARINVIHSSSESFLELQTSEGEEWVRKIATNAEDPFETWRGPSELRWSLYPDVVTDASAEFTSRTPGKIDAASPKKAPRKKK